MDAPPQRTPRGSMRRQRRVGWNWLLATACSSALVASSAYMYNAVTTYFYVGADDFETVSDLLGNDTSDSDMLLSTVKETIASSALTQLLAQVRWLLVTLVIVGWMGGLVLLRRVRTHFSLQRLISAVVKTIITLRRSSSSHRSSRRHGGGKHARGESDVDEFDMLVVSSISPLRRVLVNTSAKGGKKWIQRDPNTEMTTEARILLHPRVGAHGGRHHSNQIILEDPYVSRYHFQIQYEPLEKEYYLQDLGSTTGTFIFIKPEVPKRLNLNDRVKVGDTEFEVVAIDQSLSTNTCLLRICFTEGPLTGIGQTIGHTTVTLGRRSSNALCITDDAAISGKHCAVSYVSGGFYITDLNSTNGTAIRLSASGEKSQRRYLRHGDVFGVGSSRFLVEYAHQLEVEDIDNLLDHHAVLRDSDDSDHNGS
ncbi:TPA: hypothetical protein N0F65_002233 [Lagenidium giganteum]|uniref:FHA domain-containing protein n=1 Tax=Lagenidium giganteum TaxID=4803 RepID=A0AAV2YW25_9STRA|nr:TPA: hypothetical protein N0F65_002233 [Lagenidium giganteum]